MKILGIESSCDETAMAIVSGENDVVRVKKNLVASQMKLHEQYGGVVPEVAARAHAETIVPMLSEIAKPNGAGIDAIAVTQGPGLVVALRVGVQVARTLAHVWQKPLVGVNHLEGHVYSNWIQHGRKARDISFPALVLIVSGGHTEIVFMKRHGHYKLVGETRDDASGEAFDKVAKMLGLGYPGGPAISKLAADGDGSRFDLPRPMLDSKDFDFSFSGLKTAVRYTLEDLSVTERRKAQTKKDMAASFQEAVVGVLVGKLTRAIEAKRPKTVLLAGGVAANGRLRERIAEVMNKRYPVVQFVAPDLQYTTDNAAMIAAAGYFQARKKNFVDPLTLNADPNLRLANVV